MTTFAAGSQVSIGYTAETTYAQIPTPTHLKNFYFMSGVPSLDRNVIVDPSIRPDRLTVGVRSGTHKISGQIQAVWRATQFDDFIEAAMGGTWTSNVVLASSSTGGTNRSFTIEVGHNDIGVYKDYTGVRINTMDISGKIDANGEIQFGILGSEESINSSPLDAAPTAALTSPALTLLGGSVTSGGTSQKLISFDLNLTNNMSALFSATGNAAYDVHWLNSDANIKFAAYFSDLVEYNKFISDTTTAIVANFTDGTHTYTITIPKAKYTKAMTPVTGNAVITASYEARALVDSTLGSTLSITRT